MLLKQSQSGNKYANERLIMAHMRIVLKFVYSYREKTTIPIEELFSVVMQGVIQGLCEYDIANNGYLTSYINLWINQRVDRCIANTERFIRIPIHAMEILELEKKYAHANSKQEITSEISKDLNMSEKEIKQIFFVTSPIELPEELFESGLELEDYDVNVEDEIENKSRNKMLLEYISSLPKKNKKVILYRYGFSMEENIH